MLIHARFGEACHSCGYPITPGSPMTWQPATQYAPRRAVHRICPYDDPAGEAIRIGALLWDATDRVELAGTSDDAPVPYLPSAEGIARLAWFSRSTD